MRVSLSTVLWCGLCLKRCFFKEPDIQCSNYGETPLGSNWECMAGFCGFHVKTQLYSDAALTAHWCWCTSCYILNAPPPSPPTSSLYSPSSNASTSLSNNGNSVQWDHGTDQGSWEPQAQPIIHGTASFYQYMGGVMSQELLPASSQLQCWQPKHFCLAKLSWGGVSSEPMICAGICMIYWCYLEYRICLSTSFWTLLATLKYKCAGICPIWPSSPIDHA